MQALLKDLESRMSAAIDALGREFATVRTGRASAALLDALRVDYYGTPTPINQMASISTPDARTLVIQPWEASQLKAVEKAIIASDLGVTPMNDGKILRLTMPSPTEERRGHDQIQKVTDKHVARIDELLKKKEQEILSF